jgi:hypothetical protein
MIKLIQKKIDQKPRRWHSVLSEALWAYRMAPLLQRRSQRRCIQVLLQSQ